MDERDMRKWIYISLLGMIIGEILIADGYIYDGLIVHMANIFAMILMIIFGDSGLDIKNIFQSFILIILFRVINLSMPTFSTNILLIYILIYGMMFLPIYMLIKRQSIPIKELGINFRRLYIYLPLALIIGIITAIIEYDILNTAPLIENMKLSNIILLSIIMFVFVGTIEELIFRSILLTRLQKSFSLKYGLIINGIIFGMVHSSYGINEVIFTGVFGMFLGYIFIKTNSLPFIVSIHGIENVILFGILPLR